MADRYDGYIRVSRVAGREGESFISPDEQRAKISQWASLRGVEIAQWHTDLDQSGGKLSRPGLDALLRRLRAGQTQGAAMSDLDRLSRAGVADALRLIEEIHELGGRIAVVSLGIDPMTPFGEFAMTIMLALARMQRRRTAENWETARRRAVERGVHVASRTPTGYARDDTGRLVPHGMDARVITELFRRKAAGASWRELCGLLNEHAVEGPYQAVQWTQRAVSHILANRVYLGEARSGEFINPDAHQALVSRDVFEAAQRSPLAAVQRSGEPALLAGLLRCAGCRHLMKPDTQRMRDGTKARIYRCRGVHAAGTCQSRAAVLGSVVEPYIVEWMFREAGRIELRRRETDERGAELEQEARDADADLAAYRDDERILATLGQDRYVEGLQVRVRRSDEAHARLADFNATVSPVEQGTVATLRQVWDDLDVPARQRALRLVIEAVMLRSIGQGSMPIEDRTCILKRGHAPADLPRRGRRVPLQPFAWPDRVPDGAGEMVGEDLGEPLRER